MSYSPNFRGNAGKGSSRQTQTGYTNGTGSTITAASAVYSTASGIGKVDVSDINTVEKFAGLVAADLLSAAHGLVVSDGRLENIPIGLGFAVGDPIWVGTVPGSLTKVKPDLANPGWVSGDFVIFVGVVVENEFDPLKQDIQLFKQITGRL